MSIKNMLNEMGIDTQPVYTNYRGSTQQVIERKARHGYIKIVTSDRRASWSFKKMILEDIKDRPDGMPEV